MDFHSLQAMHDHAFTRHLPILYGYAIILTRNREEAKDLVQETYLRAVRAIKRFRPGSNLKAWLFTILRNIWRNEIRRKSRSAMSSASENHDDAVPLPDEHIQNPHRLYEAGLSQARVQEAIRRLPAHFQQIIILREFEELSYKEIASVLNGPTGTVMSRIGRARLRLKELLLESPA